ncbi:MAG: oligosaccharide flippase family protein [Patescibacteria group bacterium]|nr:oligosaccharide flippase family protein [Patescibacteria group bacterium]
MFSKIFSWSRFIIRHPFTRHTAILQVGGVIGKAVGLVASVLYANLLGPEEFGVYSLAIALAGFLNIFQEFGMSHALVNLLARAEARHDQADAKDLLAYFLKATVAIGATSGLAGILIAPWLGGLWYHSPMVGWLAAIGVLAFSLTFFVPLVTTIQQVRRELVPLAVLETGSKIFGAALTVGLVLAGFGALGVIGGQFLTMVISSLAAVFFYRRYVHANTAEPLTALWRTRVPWSKISYYFRFGFLIAVSKNILKFNQTVPLLVLGAVLPTASGLGFFKVALTYVAAPLVLTDPAIRLLSDQFPKTEVSGTAKLFRRFYQVTALTILLQAVLTVPMLLLAPFVVTVVFPDYRAALPFIYALAPYTVLIASGAGLSAMFRTLNRMQANVIIQLVTLACLIPASWFLIPRYAVRGVVIVTLFMTLLPNALGILYFRWIQRRLVAAPPAAPNPA